MLTQEADWNARHHVLHSSANHEFHESDKDAVAEWLTGDGSVESNRRLTGCSSKFLMVDSFFPLRE